MQGALWLAIDIMLYARKAKNLNTHYCNIYDLTEIYSIHYYNN